MKELSVEQKARRYDEAIKELRGMMPNWERLSYNGKTFLQDLVHIFPELKESKGEKIRKALLDWYSQFKQNDMFNDDISIKDILAWLEKQGEQKPNPVLGIEIPFGAKDSELQEASYYIPEGFHAEIEDNSVVIKRGEQKTAWSEDDENRINRLIAYFEDKESFTAEDDVVYADWLKSLKDRIQPKQEWSEEDKRKIDRIYFILRQAADTHAFSTTCRLIGDKECVDLQDFLKSLIPQSQWKPSDEQMKCLSDVVHKSKYKNDISVGGYSAYMPLASLYLDLKKLKG